MLVLRPFILHFLQEEAIIYWVMTIHLEYSISISILAGLFRHKDALRQMDSRQLSYWFCVFQDHGLSVMAFVSLLVLDHTESTGRTLKLKSSHPAS